MNNLKRLGHFGIFACNSYQTVSLKPPPPPRYTGNKSLKSMRPRKFKFISPYSKSHLKIAIIPDHFI
jgi:hypothetical protein